MTYLHLVDGWRLSEDGRLQWILQRKRGKRWRDRAWCGTRQGLLDYLTTMSPLLARS